ncbi:MAG TPA: hypothetical protein IAB31_13120 [Candidatus Choladousia intestinavium]|uniref:Uncharacterized protein n=1 Tax=Candidatus Choladousia intestinavium TaxID=2840727 RepID=A0A9D1DAA1_9FIRM|nr:hypothetical protein [Candidatus Choladousia intestinavium]
MLIPVSSRTVKRSGRTMNGVNRILPETKPDFRISSNGCTGAKKKGMEV